MQDQNIILVISVSLGLILIVFAFVVLILIQYQRNLRQKQKDIFKAVLEAEEKEQNRLGQNLHDDMCPLLAIASTQLNFAATDKDTKPEQAQQLLSIWEQLNNINKGLRQLSHELVAFDVKGKTLGQAIEDYAYQHNQIFDFVHCSINKNFNQLDAAIVSQLYRISKELIYNAAKHSMAKQLWVELSLQKNGLVLFVKDDGAAFSDKTKPGIGLQNIKKRCKFINAHFTIENTSNKTVATLSFPLKNL